jgi:ribosomal protein L11 methyltransferase
MTEKQWLKLTIQAAPGLLGSIEDYLVGLLEAGVETAAKDEPGFGIIQAYLQQENLSDAAVASIVRQVEEYLAHLAQLMRVSQPSLAWEMIGEEDWGKSWKRYFDPFAIIPGLVIAPSWADYQTQEGELVITMDPGMAFGTGHHATTRLCLAFLKENVTAIEGGRILDVGTGTGILGMAGLLFGAQEVVATDNDPEAVRVARENVEANELSARMTIALASLTSFTASFDIVVANIVHDVLMELADDLVRLACPRGLIILSGLLNGEQVDNIRHHFVAKGCDCLDQRSDGEWAALCLRRLA